MSERDKISERNYIAWLILMCMIGSVTGWGIQGMLDSFILWTLPLFFLGSIFITMNGDNIVESTVVLLVLGGLVFALSTVDAIVSQVSVGTIIAIYCALFISKFGFALSKEGVFGNKPFS